MRRIKVTLNPTVIQQEILQSCIDNRITVAACGRRFGKTLCAMMAMFIRAVRFPKSRIIFAAPTYLLAKTVWKEMLATPGVYDFLDAISPKTVAPVPTITFANGSQIQFFSMDKTSGKKRGQECHLLVMDECREMNEQVFTSTLYPMVGAVRGNVLLTSTFKGADHWFSLLHEKGMAPNKEKIRSFLCPSSMGIAFQGESGRLELEQFKAMMSDAEFRCEFMCEKIQTGENVFKAEHIDACLDGCTQTFSNEPTMMAVDLGRVKDPTSLAIKNGKGHVIKTEVLPLHQDWDIQFNRIHELAKQYKSLIILETNGTNSDSVVALVKARMPGIEIKAVMVKDDVKESMIRRVQYDFEKRAIHIDKNDLEFVKQLRNYEVTRTKGRTLGMECPHGHDDLVIALALLQEGTARGWLPTGPGISIGNAF